MAFLALDSVRSLLLLCIILSLLSVVFQVLSLLSWDGVSQEFVAVIHSTAIHIAYICVVALLAILNVVCLFSLRGVDDVYYMNGAQHEVSDF